MNRADTIFAASSGQGRAGVSVVRFSGTGCLALVKTLCGVVPVARRAELVTLRGTDGDVIDRCLCLYFPKPASVTGEDVLEFHLHGSPAVVARFFSELAGIAHLRLAEAGEFTRRAFVNGKMDLVEVEGLADLLDAESEPQRRLAMRQFLGHSSHIIDSWRQQLIAATALVEAAIDFSDEADVASDVLHRAQVTIRELASGFRDALSLSTRVGGLRDGLRIVIGGPPNAGKSSLYNELSDRNAAIVSALPGTTRDVLETAVRIAGLQVALIDTAGLRESTTDPIEREGIRRAAAQYSDADILIWVLAEDCALVWPPDGRKPELIVFNKLDLGAEKLIQIRNELPKAVVCAVSLATGEGLASLKFSLSAFAEGRLEGIDQAVVVRERHRAGLQAALTILEAYDPVLPPEVLAHELRRAADCLAGLVGSVGVEDYLGHIFSSFCIGK